MKEVPLKFPKKGPPFPKTLLIGDFTLTLNYLTSPGTWNPFSKEFIGASGTAWLKLDCGTSHAYTIDARIIASGPVLPHPVEVVSNVLNPQTEISYQDAQRIQPETKVGENLTLYLNVQPSEFQEVLQVGKGVLGWLETKVPKGGILVKFEGATVQVSQTLESIGRIVQGTAIYPTQYPIPKVIQRKVSGFTLTIFTLTLTPEGASGHVSVQLPGGIASVETCLPVTLDLGQVSLTPGCDLYVDAHDQAFGPWLLGDTGLKVQGTGFILDLSKLQSPSGKPAGWRGLLLQQGQASGKELVPEPCNTGYLRGIYGFTNAEVIYDGFYGQLNLQETFSFDAINPYDTIFSVRSGWLHVGKSRVDAGELGPGEIKLSRKAVCRQAPGQQVIVKFNHLSVQTDLDLMGEVEYGGRPLSWGELTQSGTEMIVWMTQADHGLCYLPAGPLPSYCPVSGSSFISPSISYVVDASLTELDVHGIAGVTFHMDGDVTLFSPDRPGDIGNPILFPEVQGWLRVGSLGVDGELINYRQMNDEKIGEPARSGYVGVEPFITNLFTNDKRNLLAQFVTSAVYESNFNGIFKIPEPCDIPNLEFNAMQITSTGHLVGGDIALPPGGVALEYWKLKLVPIGNPNQTGVVSVRTGRIIFIAAGISEDIHFAEPFRLTWGEMLPDGNLGQLFFDFNNYGQKFDGIPYNPHQIMLSKFVFGTPDPYLATCGSIHFSFFGPGYVNIRDAYNFDSAEPYFNRLVKVPKTGEITGCQPTNLHLAGTWKDITSNDLAVFDCPDAKVDYNQTIQEGFIGTGKGEIGFFHSDGLDILVEIHSDATDIRLSSLATHDMDFNLYARMGGIKQIVGCARIEGPLLTRMSFYGVLEHSTSTGFGILEPKAGIAVEININTTPNSLDFYASGDMLMSISGVDLELAALVHLLYDYAQGSAEGEVIGRVDCDAGLAGLSGEGQLTWYAGPTMQYLQGRMKVYVCSWLVSGGLEGGFFIGHQVPKQLAWVLRPTNPHFGVSDAILPATLTGVFGYGQISLGVNYYVLGGGVSLYAGMGAFSETPPGLTSKWTSVAGLPYVLGACGIYAHGEILGGLVSASAWGNLSLRGPVPTYFEGTFGLQGCVAWVVCASVDITGGINSTGFYLY